MNFLDQKMVGVHNCWTVDVRLAYMYYITLVIEIKIKLNYLKSKHSFDSLPLIFHLLRKSHGFQHGLSQSGGTPGNVNAGIL
jgi:hypothetical protein